MFERLFTRLTAARHRAGPLASSREQFLERCAADGHKIRAHQPVIDPTKMRRHPPQPLGLQDSFRD